MLLSEVGCTVISGHRDNKITSVNASSNNVKNLMLIIDSNSFFQIK